ncbi:MAG: hypothetical protein KAJ63_08060 [Methyloprofundus sp.]|nr:hypothetical protein [Methyloprofundus sp.]
MRNLLEFKLENGESAFMQIEATEHSVTRGNAAKEPAQASRRFEEAVSCIVPIAKT